MRRGIDCYASAGTMESLKVIKHHRAHGVDPLRLSKLAHIKSWGSRWNMMLLNRSGF